MPVSIKEILYFHYVLIVASLLLLPHFVVETRGEPDWAMCSYYPQVASNRPTAGLTSNRKLNHFQKEHISYLHNFDLKEDYFSTSPFLVI